MGKVIHSKIGMGIIWIMMVALVSFGAYNLGLIAEAKYERLAERPSPISNLMQQDRYDEAVQIALNENKEGVPDGQTFDEVALIYLERVTKDSANRQSWVKQASLYYDKATTAAPKDPFILENAMDGYDRLGDYSEKRCPDYEKAVSFGDAALALLQGTTVTIEGHMRPYPTQQIKESLVPRLSRIRGKVEAWCKKAS